MFKRSEEARRAHQERLATFNQQQQERQELAVQQKAAEAQKQAEKGRVELAGGESLVFTTSLSLASKEGEHIKTAVDQKMAEFPDFEVLDVRCEYMGTSIHHDKFLLTLKVRRK